MKRVTIYTDGSCEGNPGPGGFAAIIEEEGETRDVTGGEPHTTNNRMELKAVIAGLAELEETSQVRIVTDSQYVAKGMTSWIHGWRRKGWKTASGSPVKNREQYHTGGLESLRAIPDNSVDFIWSQAVLEHVRKADFLDTLREMQRVLGTHGVCSHRIDLTDHLGGSLNNLRFSYRIWESTLFSSSGFYTNRIRYSEMLRLFGEAGFDVQVCGIDRWPSLPIARKNLAPPYKQRHEDVRLKVSASHSADAA